MDDLFTVVWALRWVILTVALMGVGGAVYTYGQLRTAREIDRQERSRRVSEHLDYYGRN